MKRVLITVLCCFVFLTGCVTISSSKEIYDKGYDALQSALNLETLCYNVRYSVENGDNDIVSDFTVWQNSGDVYVENAQDRTAKLLADGAVYDYSGETDTWLPGDTTDSGELFQELLEMYTCVSPEDMTWEETDGGIRILFQIPKEENSSEYYTLTVSFSSEWLLTAYTVDPMPEGNGEKGFYPVKTEVVLLNTDPAEVRDVINGAKQKAIKPQE